ncbi:MarR family transcriptional regulator [Fusibacter paucivorans]|uniref:MarR family transcriptional regulator n=1 Tax=Fusibacter paucivorans TaxID=76009 RepID=A0ABS5PS42_9FIRM|nr:helix-turn-helix domain-containing GNAT family N-acetyltransferase [Fusibacter paucivorans]MBS7527386.1 MarR family transcriptional regulator [Fusibacter paucivorans]
MESMIADIRSFNRFYTNILGLLDQSLLGSGYSLTDVRVMLEISLQPFSTAKTLIHQLNIDPSYMSRIIKRLETDGLLEKIPSELDNRLNNLKLTTTGEALIQKMDAKSHDQMKKLLRCLSEDEVRTVVSSMQLIKAKFSEAFYQFKIRDFTFDDIDYVISRHKILYQNEYRLTQVFSDHVDATVNAFAEHFNPERECMFIAEMSGKPVGSIAVASMDDQTAQLRFFLLEPKARGIGIGKKLVDAALLFCIENNYTSVFLDTFSDLKTARYLYAQKGFEIISTHANESWGKNILEERWALYF